jgi:hypothetical protein
MGAIQRGSTKTLRLQGSTRLDIRRHAVVTDDAGRIRLDDRELLAISRRSKPTSAGSVPIFFDLFYLAKPVVPLLGIDPK